MEQKILSSTFIILRHKVHLLTFVLFIFFWVPFIFVHSLNDTSNQGLPFTALIFLFCLKHAYVRLFPALFFSCLLNFESCIHSAFNHTVIPICGFFNNFPLLSKGVLFGKIVYEITQNINACSSLRLSYEGFLLVNLHKMLSFLCLLLCHKTQTMYLSFSLYILYIF